jgi:hypothetical protein
VNDGRAEREQEAVVFADFHGAIVATGCRHDHSLQRLSVAGYCVSAAGTLDEKDFKTAYIAAVAEPASIASAASISGNGSAIAHNSTPTGIVTAQPRWAASDRCIDDTEAARIANASTTSPPTSAPITAHGSSSSVKVITEPTANPLERQAERHTVTPSRRRSSTNAPASAAAIGSSASARSVAGRASS